ncbi:MAG: peroxiredoxin family protein [Planctomycetota bacterium]|jgi:hypothetical protein
MWNDKKTIVVVALFSVALGPLCWVGRAQGTANEKLPSAVELLDRYTESQDKLQSIIARGETSSSAVSLRDDDKEEYASLMFSEFRSDGSRMYHGKWSLVESRSTDTRDRNSVIPERSSRESLRLYDGRYTFHFWRGGRVQIELEKDGGDGFPTPPPLSYRGRELMGYFFSDGERVDSILRRSEKVSVRDKLERVGRSKCYVIDAVTERGRYTLWIDPEHGYNIAKAQKEAGDRRLPKGKGESSFLKNVKFEKIDGVWVPMGGDMEFGHQGPGWDYREKKHHKRREVILNPDHEALRSFYPDGIPSATEVGMGFAGSPPDRNGLTIEEPGDFLWKPGAQFVVNESCRVVRKDDNKHLLPIVKALDIGELVRDFKVAPAPAATKGTHIVLCFWDVNRKQSQQLLLAFRDRQQALAQKGVSVIAVEASGAKTDKVRIWAKENDLPYSLGAFYTFYEGRMEDRDEDDDDKPVLSETVSDLLAAYRADRLPWLILTDKEHVVTAEGFTLEELEEKINEIETF